ncbi:MAG: hypothetical protein ACRC5C_03655 [Bacilli bacterium]
MKIQVHRILIIGTWSISMLILVQLLLVFWNYTKYPFYIPSMLVFPTLQMFGMILSLCWYSFSILLLLIHCRYVKAKILHYELRRTWLFIFGISYCLMTVFLLLSKSLIESIIICPLMCIAAIACLWIRHHVPFTSPS